MLTHYHLASGYRAIGSSEIEFTPPLRFDSPMRDVDGLRWPDDQNSRWPDGLIKNRLNDQLTSSADDPMW